jgi:hypothetical protein
VASGASDELTGLSELGSKHGGALEARDIDWSYGSGEALRGSAEDLARGLCGRTVPPGRLQGKPLGSIASIP